MEQLKEHYRTRIYNATGFFFSFFILCVLASPFLYVWVDFALAFKIGITGLIGMVATIFIAKLAINAVIYSIEKEAKIQEEIEQNIPVRKPFQERLKEKMAAK